MGAELFPREEGKWGIAPVEVVKKIIGGWFFEKFLTKYVCMQEAGEKLRNHGQVPKIVKNGAAHENVKNKALN